MNPIMVGANDPIACITASEKYLIVAQNSGLVGQYLFPSVSHVHKFQVNCIPSQVALNRNSSKLYLVDKSTKLYLYDFDASNDETGGEGCWLDIDQRDIWDLKWSADNNDLLAVVEKSKLIIYNIDHKGMEKEEPIALNGNICLFQDLAVKSVALDNLVCDYASGQIVDVGAYLETVECESVRQLRDKLEDSLTEAVNYVLQLPNHPRLWQVISEESLLRLDLETAKLAMIKIKDFIGIQFIKKLAKLNDDVIKRAEVFTYLSRLEDAEHVYLKNDRPDLAISLNKQLGRHDKALRLLDGKFVWEMQNLSIINF